VDREASQDYKEWRDRIQSDLVAQACDEDEPNFLTFLKSGKGFLTLNPPEQEGACLLAFSSPLRAADYASVAAPKQAFEYLCTSAKEVVVVLRACREQAGLGWIALDRCPRCDACVAIETSQLDSGVDVMRMRNISKSSEIARCSLYQEFARSAARRGEFVRARDVALELVGHVTAENPRTHLLLGKLAIHLHDRRLVREAKDFLAVLQQSWAIAELENAERTRVFEF